MIWGHQSSGWYYRTLAVVAVAIVAEVFAALAEPAIDSVEAAEIAIDPVEAAAGGIRLEIELLQTFLVVAVEEILQQPENQLGLGIEHWQIHLAVGCCTWLPGAEPIHFAVASAGVVQTQTDRILAAFQSQQP